MINREPQYFTPPVDTSSLDKELDKKLTSASKKATGVQTAEKTRQATTEFNLPPEAEQKLTQPDALNPSRLHQQTINKELNSKLEGLQLEKLPLKGLKNLVRISVLLLVFIAVWQLVSLYQSALATHWLLAGGLTLMLLWLAFAISKTLINYLRGRQSFNELDVLRQQAQRLADSVDLGSYSQFTQELATYYHNKPQAELLRSSLVHLPSYSNDAEALAYLEANFLAPLDQEALRRVSTFSLQTAVGVSLSPWVSLDMALALWRNVKMLDEVAQVYGIRPSLATRMRLFNKVLNQLVLVGATEAAIGQFYEELSLDTLGGLVALRGMQGLGAGAYSLRIGITAMTLCRPVEFNATNRPKLSDATKEMFAEAKKLLTRKRAK